ncbi:MAG: zinc dependent phospholipase C family protein [Candidatus Heimdallarchaeaceae archaeon]
MSRRITHFIGGCAFSLPIIGVTFYFFSADYKVWRLILILSLSLVTILFGSVFPDIIEKPTNPEHRKLFHSWIVLTTVFIIAFIMCFVVLPRTENPFFLYPLFGFFLGYLSHLLLDSSTKKGLT